jgi:pimeloyl-ACP methyl ester carboxylesterase
MACWAAGQQRVKEAVEPMISLLHWVNPRTGEVQQEGETHPRVHPILCFNLEEITGNTTLGTDVDGWKQYWEQNKDKALPPIKRFGTGTFGDVKLSFNDTYARRGTGPLVIALPATHRTTLYYMPYFNQWQFVKWLFIDLPPITSFPNVEKDRDGDPIYPVDLLVDAFEDMRKQRRAETMILLGQGFTCWVCAKYAQKYPDRVEGLILLNPFASNETFRKRIDEALRSGDEDMEYWGKVSSKQIKIATRYEGEVYGYYNDTAALGPKEQDDIEIGILRKIWHEPEGSDISIPQFDIRGEETSRTPVLMWFAKKGTGLTGIDDLNRLKRYYPKHVWVDGGNKSARLPFMQDPEKFEKALRLFIDKKVD